jgi:hypothetical protein
LNAACADFDADAAVFGGVINFRAAETERVFDAFDNGLVAERFAAAHDHDAGAAPIGEAAGVTARGTVVRGGNDVIARGIFGEDIVEARRFQIAR